MTDERPTRQYQADVRPFFVKHTEEGTGVKFFVKPIEEGKKIIKFDGSVLVYTYFNLCEAHL